MHSQQVNKTLAIPQRSAVMVVQWARVVSNYLHGALRRPRRFSVVLRGTKYGVFEELIRQAAVAISSHAVKT